MIVTASRTTARVRAGGPPSQLRPLTALRFFAAALIVQHHIYAYFTGYPVPPPSLDQGVSFFFVLSGFILSYVHSELPDGAAIRRFWIARLARIWPIHVVTALATLALFRETVTHTWEIWPNLMLIQSWVPFWSLYFALNAVSWSISTEAFFYLVFPLLIRNVERTWAWKLAGSAALVAALTGLTRVFSLPLTPTLPADGMRLTAHGLLYISPLARIFEFTLGICTWLAWRRWAPSLRPGVALATLLEGLIVTLAVMGVAVWATRANVWIWSVVGPELVAWSSHTLLFGVWAVLIFVMALQRGLISRALAARPFVLLGEISFSVYMIHAIWLRAAVKWMPPRLAADRWILALHWVGICTLSFFLWKWIELPARRAILQAWDGRLGGRPRAGVFTSETTPRSDVAPSGIAR